MMPELIKLNLGCGPKSKHKNGWINIDIMPPADMLMDLTQGIDFDTNSVDAIYADNLMEHFQADTDLVTVLNECWRVLKPEGTMTIIVPSAANNFDAAFGDPGHKTYFLPRLFEYWTHGARRRSPWGEKYGYKPWVQVSLKHTSSITVVQKPYKVEAERKTIFNEIYKNKKWRYGSGTGSTPEYTKGYNQFLQNYMKTAYPKINTVLDLGCGDWQSTQLIDWTGINYIGIDIVPAMISTNQVKFESGNIRFFCGDILEMPLPQADLVIVKDVINHWNNDDIFKLLNILKTYSLVFVVGNNNEHVEEGGTGRRYRPIDLAQDPFNVTVKEIFKFRDKSVWEIRN